MIENAEGNIAGIVSHLFRHEAGKMAAVLTRKFGTSSLDEVDDIVQDTLLRALETWKIKGLPDNPSAWLHKVAYHRAIDFLRKKKRASKILEGQLSIGLESDFMLPVLVDEKEIEDSVLQMMFACCHPAIAVESQIAFILKMLGGLTVKEIANAFLTSEDTIAKRIYRAKEKMREEKIELISPSVFEIPQRLNSILQVLYLLFNEGYYSSNPQYLIREDLCEEAMRLTSLLLKNMYTNQPSVKGLLALMCFQVSRFPARSNAEQSIILLEYQDRSLWNKDLIRQGFYFLDGSVDATSLSEYQIEAAIASIHSIANSFQKTNWQEILRLYEILEAIKPGLTVSFNKAIAIGYAQTPQQGLQSLKLLSGLEESQYYHAAIGNFYLMTTDLIKARASFTKAISLAKSEAEIELLQQKLKSIT